MAREKEKIYGCLLGGAIGDALGYPVEFMSHNRIIETYGDAGINDLEKGNAFISDDTQMTLFTAEGILLTTSKERVVDNIYLAYLRWLSTQGYNIPVVEEGWLIHDNRLHARRAPGNSCISSLQSGKMGTIVNPINNSKGCGGVMRVAPLGVLCPPDEAFTYGMETAAITHGHPSGYYPAGALARIISLILKGEDLVQAVEDTMNFLKEHEGSEETLHMLQKAHRLSQEETGTLEAINSLGQGWVGEEALAIAVYCSLRFKDDFKNALIAAVNHDGDSDSTGAITGNIMGAALGTEKIPEQWGYRVELRDKINMMAERLLYKHELYYI